MPCHSNSLWSPGKHQRWGVPRGARVPPIFLPLSLSSRNKTRDSKCRPVTCDHGPRLHCGGQAWLLQACTCVGVLTGQRECTTASSFWKAFFCTHWILRLCCPPAHDLLHSLHSPGFQLAVKNKITCDEAEALAHPFRSTDVSHPMKAFDRF